MGFIRGQYSISDLLEMDAKGKKSIIPYVCLAEATEEDYLLSCKTKFMCNTDRVADFLEWMSDNRKLVFTLYKYFNRHFISSEHLEMNELVNSCMSILYFYMINEENSINCRIKLNIDKSGVVSLLQMKAGNRNKAGLSKDIMEVVPEKLIEVMARRVLEDFEYEAELKLNIEVPDSFYAMEMLMHDYILIEAGSAQIELIENRYKEKSDKLGKLTMENHYLSERVQSLKERVSEFNGVKGRLDSALKDSLSQVDLLEKELLVMQNKLTSVEDRNRILSLTVSKEEECINEQLMEEENEVIDLSKYNIVLCGNDRHLGKYDYKILDYYAGPQRVTMLDKADVIAIITTDIEHAAYWCIKSYCKNHGLKFCNINGNTPRIVESGLKNYIRENLL